MLRSLLILAPFLALWTVVLWFGVTPDFAAWSIPRLVATHILPPVLPWGLWMAWRHRRQVRQAHDAEQRTRQAEAERQTRLDAARQQHDEELRHRRQACDCRVVAMSDLVVHGRFELPEADQVGLKSLPADAVTHGGNLLAAFRSPVKDALRQVYVACGAAAVLPIYLQPPVSVAAVEAIALVRDIHRELVDELALPLRLDAGMPPVSFLVAADSAANGVTGLFEQQPDLPGAVILSFDSPLVQMQLGIAGDRRPSGAPSHAAVALLVTHRQLPEMLGTLVADNAGEVDALTPYWDRGLQLAGNLALLAPVPQPLRTKLSQLPVLARIHRSACGEAERPGIMGLTRHLKYLLERAQVNAGLLAMPFASTEGASESGSPEDTEETSADACQWLVHNAGSVESMGERLTAIGTALAQRGMELKPIDMATNIVSHIGDLGRARSVTMLAIGLARAATHEAPVMVVDFESNNVSVGFVMPATTS